MVQQKNFEKASINNIVCSVCIANYNGEEYLSECIDSVLSQDIDFNIEIIVHDDASDDNSVELVESTYPSVILIRSQQNRGFCDSNNIMVDTARAKFILLLNNDAKLHPNALRTLFEAYTQHGEGIYGLTQYHWETKALIDNGSVFDYFLNPIPNTDVQKEDVGMIIGACLFLSRELWYELGGFPSYFGSLSEDMYICFLARLWGYPVKALNRSGFDHWVGRSLGGGKITSKQSLSTTLNRRAKSERNKTFVMFICFPSFLMWLFLPFHLFLLSIEGIALSLVKWEKRLWREIYLNCLREVWCRRHQLYSHRRKIQAKRDIPATEFFRNFSLFPHKLRMLIRHGVPVVK